MHKLAQPVLAYIRKNDLLRPGDCVGVAVSGGADSVALLRLLIDLRGELGIVLSVVHLNHKLRGSESDADEQFARELAAANGLEFICESCDVKQYAAEKKLSLETAAREVRYQFFERRLRGGPLDKIATAHTIDDQAETVLMKLARGAGTRGLAGIYPKVGIQHSAFRNQRNTSLIIRPLLGTRRSELEVYLGEISQCWREDTSNRDLRHTRNRIRHGILPRLERHVNPSVRETLAETAEIARAEEEYWTKEVGRLLPEVWTKAQKTGILNGKRLEELPPAVQRRLVRAAAESLGLGLEFRHVEDILSLRHEGSCAALPGNWVAFRHKGEIRFEPASAELQDYDYEYQLAIPGSTVVSEAGLVLEALFVNGNCSSERYNPEHLLDAPAAKVGLVVRTWRAGERFWPLHSKEPKKIKELLQDRHVTGDDKKRWPVVANGDEIVWMRGLGVSRDFQAKSGAGLLIRELPLS